MDITIHDIAKLVGVSKSTVSRALSSSTLISDETKQKILIAAEQLNYKPNSIARAMVTKKTGNIGFIIYQKHKPVLSHPFYAPIIESVASETNQNGYGLFILSDQDVKLFSGDKILYKKVDGVILASKVSKDVILNFRKDNIPVVLINNIYEDHDVCCVINSDYQGTTEAIEYLIGQGHKKIAFLSGPLEHYSYSQRYNAYIDTLKKHDIVLDYNLVQITDSTMQHGFNAMQTLFKCNSIPAALFCANDMMAIGAMKAIKKEGLSIPRDISVVGFDDIEFSSLVEPALTTVWTDKVAMGKIAVDYLFKMIDGETFNDMIIRQETKLIIRESA